MKNYYLYIITNYNKTTLYTGVTNDLERRLQEHKQETSDSFSKHYKLKYLVYYEESPDVDEIIEREKQIKKWNRQWKEELINSMNPKWEDLSKGWEL